MAILVHPARATHDWLRAGVRQGDRMYHVLSDLIGPAGSAELRAFAVRYGLRPEWVQYAGTYREHFDARAVEGRQMLEDGAHQAANREVGQVLAAKRQAAQARAGCPAGE
jgi:hypothetical protein